MCSGIACRTEEYLVLGIFCFSSGIECSVIAVLGKTEHKPSRTECSVVWCSEQHCRLENVLCSEPFVSARPVNGRPCSARQRIIDHVKCSAKLGLSISAKICTEQSSFGPSSSCSEHESSVSKCSDHVWSCQPIILHKVFHY